MCACDHEVLIGYWSNPALKQHVMSPQLSEKGFHNWELHSSRTVPGEAILPPSTKDCLLHNCFIIQIKSEMRHYLTSMHSNESADHFPFLSLTT